MISLTSPVKTRAHQWPVAAKVAALCIATTTLFMVQSVWFQLGAFVFCLVLYALPGWVFFRAGLQAMRPVLPFAAVIFLWHLAFYTALEGVEITVRVVTMIALANLVTMTTPLEDFVHLLRFLNAPLRRLGMPTQILETAIPLVIRFSPVLIAKAGQLVEAWRARSRRRPGWQLVLPLSLAALDDADHVAEALRARGGTLK
ncbi:energy-coupling factor transporter transmembrane component T family protein [Brucella sp. 22210]|uniref:energy-coupling factor transporter transmembrane component T family protein n=1 Tax=Brucella sp. 22210 TaxID=3453892 RepID=UPI003F86AA6C